jgi:protein-disulfide isomerase
MASIRVFALVPATALVTVLACSAPDPSVTPGRSAEAAAAYDPAAAFVVAEVNGKPITRAELDEKAASSLTRLRQEEFEILSRALDELIADRLLDVEAEEREMTRAELLKEEVTRRVTPPASAHVAALYEQNKSRFGDATREEAVARIEEILLQRATAERQRSYAASLREKATVSVHLDPPRVALDIPPDPNGTGPEDAAVTIVEFSDYQCPYCHRAQGVVDQLLADYEGKIRFVHLDFPLDNHPEAVPAARAARCAGEQDRFWDYHRSLMLQRGDLDDADLKARAVALDLNAAAFAECLASDKYDDDIVAELEYGSSVGVTGTPAYFINGRMVSGARPYPDFAQIIDAELAGD